MAINPNDRMKELLRKLSGKEITLDELLLKCAEWTAESLDNYKFTPLPERPQEMEFYERVPKDQRQYLGNEFWDAHPQILQYSKTLLNTNSENKALYDWLVSCQKILTEKGLLDQTQKIEAKLSTWGMV